jgi:hypothetical protein
MKTIGLCMIVKNEAPIILRCLESVRPLVDYVSIDDTGSTDGTQAVIREWLDREGVPGEVVDEPWRDFAHNRSLALARLRERRDIDYAFVMDADDLLRIEPGFDPAAFKAGMAADLYDITLRAGSIEYRRGCICGNRLPFKYVGVVHEYLDRPEGAGRAVLIPGLTVLSSHDGARGQDPDKYRRDIAVLERALLTETDEALRSRYVLYLAQSYRSAGDRELALINYLKRAGLGFWAEEVFISLYRAGTLMEELDYPDHEIIGIYLKAHEARPARAETLFAAARYCRRTRRHHQGYMIGRHAATIPQPAEGLFLLPWVYEYGILDDLSICAYWTGRYRESLELCDRLLTEARVPASLRPRIEKNRDFALRRLGIEPAPAEPFPQIMIGFG